MAITENDRYQLYKRLEQILGHDEATTLMEHLPPVGWADVATKTDLDQLHVLTKADISQLRTELKGDFGQLRTELKADMEVFEARLGGRLDQGFRDQTRTMVLANMGTLVAFGSLLIAAVKL